MAASASVPCFSTGSDSAGKRSKRRQSITAKRSSRPLSWSGYWHGKPPTAPTNGVLQWPRRNAGWRNKGTMWRWRRCSRAALKGVFEGVLLAPDQAIEIDELVLERDLMFGLEIPAVERRVVRAQAVVDARRIQPPSHLAHWGEICEGPSLQIRARAEFETDATLAYLR